MKTIHKKLVGIFGITILLFSQNLKSQTYYGFTYSLEKNLLGPTDVKQSAVVISSVFKIEDCSNLNSYQYKNSIISGANKKFVKDYERKISKSRSPWYLDYRAETKLFDSYNEAVKQRRITIDDYESRNRKEAIVLDMNLNCEDF